MLGNPFASGLMFGGEEWKLNNIGNYAKIWTSGGYKDGLYVDGNIAVGNVIAAHQGFFVQVQSPGPGSLTIPASKRVHGGSWGETPEEENGEKNTNVPRIKLIARAQGSELQQQHMLIEVPGQELHVPFLQGHAPVFYALPGEKPLSTLVLPQIDEETVIPYVFEKNNEGSVFEIILVQGMDAVTPYLHDLKLGIEHKLTLDAPYVFTSLPGDAPERFELRFGPGEVTSVPAAEMGSMAHVYASGGLLHIVFDSEAKGRYLDVFDMSGRLLHSQVLTGAAQQSQALSLPQGVYVVRILGADKMHTQRIIWR